MSIVLNNVNVHSDLADTHAHCLNVHRARYSTRILHCHIHFYCMTNAWQTFCNVEVIIALCCHSSFSFWCCDQSGNMPFLQGLQPLQLKADC